MAGRGRNRYRHPSPQHSTRTTGSTSYGSSSYNNTSQGNTYRGNSPDCPPHSTRTTGSTSYGSSSYNSTFRGNTYQGYSPGSPPSSTRVPGNTSNNNTYRGNAYQDSLSDSPPYSTRIPGYNSYGSTSYGSTFYGNTYTNSTNRGNAYQGSPPNARPYSTQTPGSTSYGSTSYGSTSYGSTRYPTSARSPGSRETASSSSVPQYSQARPRTSRERTPMGYQEKIESKGKLLITGQTLTKGCINDYMLKESPESKGLSAQAEHIYEHGYIKDCGPVNGSEGKYYSRWKIHGVIIHDTIKTIFKQVTHYVRLEDGNHKTWVDTQLSNGVSLKYGERPMSTANLNGYSMEEAEEVLCFGVRDTDFKRWTATVDPYYKPRTAVTQPLNPSNDENSVTAEDRDIREVDSDGQEIEGSEFEDSDSNLADLEDNSDNDGNEEEQDTSFSIAATEENGKDKGPPPTTAQSKGTTTPTDPPKSLKRGWSEMATGETLEGSPSAAKKARTTCPTDSVAPKISQSPKRGIEEVEAEDVPSCCEQPSPAKKARLSSPVLEQNTAVVKTVETVPPQEVLPPISQILTTPSRLEAVSNKIERMEALFLQLGTELKSVRGDIRDLLREADLLPESLEIAALDPKPPPPRRCFWDTVLN